MQDISTLDPRRKARLVDEPATLTVRRWLADGVVDFRAHPAVSLVYGAVVSGLAAVTIALLGLAGLGWLILPALAGAMLLGPLATVGLYRISRRRQGRGGGGVAAPDQIFLVSVVMMVLVLIWLRTATLLFAVFFGLQPFPGFVQSALTVFTSARGVGLFAVGSVVGGLFAAFGFAISAFSFQLLVDRKIDGFSAMALSFEASIRNLRLVVVWGGLLTGLSAVGLATAFVAFIPLFPILGYASWHAYCALFEDLDHAR